MRIIMFKKLEVNFSCPGRCIVIRILKAERDLSCWIVTLLMLGSQTPKLNTSAAVNCRVDAATAVVCD